MYYEAADPHSPVLKPEQKWTWLAGEMLVKINNPSAEFDESDNSHDSSDDDESAGVEFDKSIEQVLVFLKSDKVIELFQRSVMKRFHLVCRRLNLPSHVDRDQGTEHNKHTTGGSALNPQTCTH